MSRKVEDGLTNERRYALRHPDRRRAAEKKWLKDNPTYCMIRQAKERAKKRGLPFDLRLGDLQIPARCPVLGIQLAVGKGSKHDGSPTLDRIFPHYGYVKGNVRVISYRANRIKNDASLLELRAIVAWLERETSLV